MPYNAPIPLLAFGVLASLALNPFTMKPVSFYMMDCPAFVPAVSCLHLPFLLRHLFSQWMPWFIKMDSEPTSQNSLRSQKPTYGFSFSICGTLTTVEKLNGNNYLAGSSFL